MATPSQSFCLNCGAELPGPFCSQCGQRVMPAYPTVRETIGDTWQEVSGYDGRFARTVRRLLGHPGALTIDVLEGRRARYVSPVRLYLVASVLYFLVAAAAPNLRAPSSTVLPGSDVTIDLAGGGAAALSPEQRKEVLANVERAPWWMRPVIRSAVLDPARFRGGVLERLPRVLFALVPVFAAIVSLFYRRRRFSQHLVFALHLHAVMFIALAVRELSGFTRSPVIIGTCRAVFVLVIAGYGLVAFRRVYGDSWAAIVLKALGISVVYLIAGLVALTVTIAWTALM